MYVVNLFSMESIDRGSSRSFSKVLKFYPCYLGLRKDYPKKPGWKLKASYDPVLRVLTYHSCQALAFTGQARHQNSREELAECNLLWEESGIFERNRSGSIFIPLCPGRSAGPGDTLWFILCPTTHFPSKASGKVSQYFPGFFWEIHYSQFGLSPNW